MARAIAISHGGSAAGGRSVVARAIPFGVALLIDGIALLSPVVIGLAAHDIQHDLGNSHITGMLVAAFFLTGSVVSIAAGPWTDRVGTRATALTAMLSVCASASTIWLFGQSRPALIGAVLVAGAAFAICTPATNAMLGAIFPAQRITLLMSCKQAAIPVTLIVGSLAVPRVTSMWQHQFGVVAVVAGSGAAIIGCCWRLLATPERGSKQPHIGTGRAAQRQVASVGLAAMLSSLLPGALVAYAAIGLSSAGMRIETVAPVVAVANAAGVVARIASGIAVDRRFVDEYRLAAVMMVVGAAGALLLVPGGVRVTVAGTILAFAFGWGWSGLVYAMILRANLGHAGATGSIVHAGGLLGSALGPLVVSLASMIGPLWLGWIVVSGGAFLGAVIIFRSRPPRAQSVARQSPLTDQTDGRNFAGHGTVNEPTVSSGRRDVLSAPNSTPHKDEHENHGDRLCRDERIVDLS